MLFRPNPPLHTTITFLTESLRDPALPKYCATCMLGCVGIIYGLGGKLKRPTTRTVAKHRDFCNTIVIFLTKERSSRELSRLMSQLSECSCSLSSEPLVAVYHELGRHYVNTYKSPYHSPAAILVLLLFERPAVILRGTGGIRVAKGQGAKRWPTCTSDIIPFGPDITVKSIGQWIILLPEPMPLTFLGLSLELCGGSLFTAVTASPTFLKQFIVAFRTDCARLRQPYRWQIILHHLWLIAEFLFRAMSAATSRNSITTWTRGFEVELLKVLSDATDICFDPRLTSSDSEEAATRPAMAANIFHAFGQYSLCGYLASFQSATWHEVLQYAITVHALHF